MCTKPVLNFAVRCWHVWSANLLEFLQHANDKTVNAFSSVSLPEKTLFSMLCVQDAYPEDGLELLAPARVPSFGINTRKRPGECLGNMMFTSYEKTLCTKRSPLLYEPNGAVECIRLKIRRLLAKYYHNWEWANRFCSNATAF